MCFENGLLYDYYVGWNCKNRIWMFLVGMCRIGIRVIELWFLDGIVYWCKLLYWNDVDGG